MDKEFTNGQTGMDGERFVIKIGKIFTTWKYCRKAFDEVAFAEEWFDKNNDTLVYSEHTLLQFAKDYNKAKEGL